MFSVCHAILLQQSLSRETHNHTKHVALYTQWWNNLRISLIAHANLHDQLGQHLRKAKEAYYNLDQQIQTSFTPRS